VFRVSVLIVLALGCAGPVPTDVEHDAGTLMAMTILSPDSGETPAAPIDAGLEKPDAGSPIVDGGNGTDAGRPSSTDAGVMSFDAGLTMTPVGLVAEYSFKETQGTLVNDSSGFGSALALSLHRSEFIQRVPHGLKFTPPASPRGTNWNADKTTPIVRSAGPATKIINAIKQSGEFSVELWLKPTTLSQDGPSRVLALARENYIGCNVQVTHGAARCGAGAPDSFYQLRLLRPAGEGNGCEAIGGTPRLKPVAQHFVLTQDRSGLVSVFLDGVQVATEQRTAGLSHWSNDAALAFGNLPFAPGAPDDAHSNGRAWAGELYYVGWYDRALAPANVAALAQIPYASR
jgi:hypothetical protein